MTLEIGKVRIGVEDQERAKRFWTEVIGCQVVQDNQYGDERWLEVRLPDRVILILEQREGEPASAPEGQPNTAVFFAAEDVDDVYRDLVGRGVVFDQEPTDMPFGRWSLFRDTEGNRFPLVSR